MKKNLFYVIVANLAYMLLMAGTNFLLPAFTSVETYAMTKEYTLYITTYAELLTLGYIHGMYLKYGGKDGNEIDPKELGKNFFSYILFQIPICVIVTVVGLVIHNPLIALVGFGLFTSNFLRYYQMFYQATGDFKSYGTALNANKVLILVLYAILIFALGSDNGILYVLASPVSALPFVIILTLHLNKKVQFCKYPSVDSSEIKWNIRMGYILMLGTFVTTFFSSISKWFINYLLPEADFAYYSFAVSMENLISVFMSPVTVAMYNLFCKHPAIDEVKRIKDTTLLYAFVIAAGVFPLNFIIEHFMPKYSASMDLLVPLFAAQSIATIIKGIYVNKYKAEGQQKKYLYQMIAMLGVALVANVIAYFLFGTIFAFAVTTLVTMLVWFVFCEITNKEWRYGKKEILAFVIVLTTYLVTGMMDNVLLGCLIYAAIGILTALVLMRSTVTYILHSLFQRKKKDA